MMNIFKTKEGRMNNLLDKIIRLEQRIKNIKNNNCVIYDDITKKEYIINLREECSIEFECEKELYEIEFLEIYNNMHNNRVERYLQDQLQKCQYDRGIMIGKIL